MKTLFYVPIMPFGKDLDKKEVPYLDREAWRVYVKTVEDFWDSISDYFDTIDVSGMKIYQDGIHDGRKAAREVLEEGVKKGNKNHEIVLKLLKREAILVETEDPKLVHGERELVRAIKQSRSFIKKVVMFIKYMVIRTRLAHKKAEFVTKKIEETLDHDDRGIIFFGHRHKIQKKLANDIRIIELKRADKVKEYQELLPFYFRHQQRFVELSNYLSSEIKNVA